MDWSKLFDISQLGIIEYVILGILLFAFLYELYFYVRYIAGVNRQQRRIKKGKVELSQATPPVSIIVCAKNEAYNLEQYLLSLLDQDYPEYEVIVVDDGSEDDTATLLDRLSLVYPHLRHTFVPVDARVGSTKKLALTLAAKASKYEYFVLTDADCTPQSNQWLREMMQGFTEGKEIVIGYGAYFEESTLLNRIITYDTLFNGLQYMGMALAGHPYMGVGRNLAYKKETFLTNGGFTGMLGIRAGDDDLLVNRIANKHNTEVISSKASVTWSVPKETWKEWRMQKRRHLSVSPHYKTSSKLRVSFEPIVRAMFYASVIAACCMGNYLMIGVAALALVVRWIWQMAIVNKAARHFGQRTYHIGIILYDILLPVTTLLSMLHLAIFPKQRNRW